MFKYSQLECATTKFQEHRKLVYWVEGEGVLAWEIKSYELIFLIVPPTLVNMQKGCFELLVPQQLKC